MVSSWFPCCFLARSSANQNRPDLWSDVIKPFQVVGGFDDASGLPGPKTERDESIRSVLPNQQVESDDVVDEYII